MKILVLLKETPDTEAKIVLKDGGKSLDTSAWKYIVNPYDEYAVEEALKIKGTQESWEVVVCSFGTEATKERILKALAMGADRGLLISSENTPTADSLTIAKILAAGIRSEKPDLVLCGKQAIDDDNMHVGVMTAEILGWPHVNVVTKIDLQGSNKALIQREVEGGNIEKYEVTLPAVLGAHKSLNTPRYASLPGIMKAKKKPLDKKTPGDLGVGSLEVKTEIAGFNLPPQKAAGKMFKGEPVEAMVAKVVKLLREEAKVL